MHGIEAGRSARGRVTGSVAAFLFMICGLLAVAGCSRPPPEEALRETMAELQRAIQARDAGAIRRHLAEDFVGPGGMDRDDARRTAALYLMGHQSIGVVIGPLDLELQDAHASVRFSAAFTGGSGRLLPDSASVYQVETGWRLEDGEWRMTSARWSPAI